MLERSPISLLRWAMPAALLLACAALPAHAQTAPDPSAIPADRGSIAGRVVADATGAALDGTVVTLVDLRRRTAIGADGRFRFDALPAGSYLLRAEGPAGRGVARADVAAGAVTEVDLVVDLAVSDELVVSAGLGARSQLEVAQPTSVVAGEELTRRLRPTLGETLADQPGVTSTYFGPGASRPVIRGLGGERIRTLQGGIGSADASGASPDHAVAVDTMSAERIEILRGPATLLYGSSAVGGVVNLIDGRIPDFVPETMLSGEVELLAGSVADERAGAVSLTGGGGRFAWHADYSRRETEDYEIPGHAEAKHGEEEGEEHGEEPFGVLENSSLETASGAVGFSYVTDRGFLGVSLSGFDTLYGVPGHGHEEGEEEEGEEHEGEEEHGEEVVRIDLEQRRVDLRGELLSDSSLLRGLKVRFGVADYEHVELEGAEVGTRFVNDSWEGRVEAVQRKRGRLSGSLGLQASSSDFAAAGEEAFVPPSVTDSWALFAFEEIDFGTLAWQFGLRWENQDVDPEGDLPSRSFDGVSGSAGLVWRFAESYSFTASLSRTERLPTATELYADGPHVATRAFEIGDPDLDSEESLGIDLSLKGGGETLSGSANLFWNDFDGYIFESFTGDLEDGLEVIRFVQRDAEFWGAELAALVRLAEVGDPLSETGAGHLDLDLRADFVRAELADGTPLPRIPPLRLGAGLSYHQGPWRGLAEVRWADSQDRLADNETPTDSHTLVNASLSYRLFAGPTVTDLILRGSNLTDEEARNHVSFLKDRVPLPGRDVSLIVRLAF